jgi:type I restriction enzyme S subunit
MRQASSTGARHDRMAITNDGFMAMPLPVASPDEQQKIANCLASIDELITLEAQKLDTLKTHKKGLIQQLSPPEGETLPKLRFPEFQYAGEWEEKEVGYVFKVTRGEVLSMTLVSSPGRLLISETNSSGCFPRHCSRASTGQT